MVGKILQKYIDLPKNGTVFFTYNTSKNLFFLNMIQNSFFNDYLLGMYNQRVGSKHLDNDEIKELIPKDQLMIIKAGMEKIRGDNLKQRIIVIKNDKIVSETSTSTELKKLNFSREEPEFITDIEGNYELSEARYQECVNAIKKRDKNNKVYLEAMELLKKYIGVDKFTIPYGKNKKKTLMVHYDYIGRNDLIGYYACVLTHTPMMQKGFRDVQIAEPELQLRLSYYLLTVPKKVIDTIIAHELTHAIRALNKNYSSIYYQGFWGKFEEFMADRGIKEQLPFIKEMYKDKAQRKEALRQSHKFLKSRWLLTLGPITWLFEWKDRFTGFSNPQEYLISKYKNIVFFNSINHQ